VSSEVISCSVVITSFNSLKTLESTIRSVIMQSTKANEIFVIDDASTDGTAELIIRLNKEFDLITYVFQSLNVGQSENRNLGVSMSSCDLIVFCDDDDDCYPFRIEEHIKMHLMGAEVSYVSSEKIYSARYRRKFINSDFGPIQLDPEKLAGRVLLGKKVGLPWRLFIPGCSMAINRNTFLKSGGFNTSYRRLEDVEFAIRLAEMRAMFCWSSRISLNRFASTRPDKAGSVDISYEKKLDIDFKRYFSEEDIELMSLHTSARQLYFEGKFLEFLTFLIQNPRVITNELFFYRILNGFRRLRHDFMIYFLSKLGG
jgi:glycosyltransferase involved in cell wall biosynthesis